MDWNIVKTTAHDRTRIVNAIYCLFDDIDRANDLLYTVIDSFFADREQKPISADDAKWIGSLLYTASEIISDAVLSYNLLTANTEDPRVERYLDAADMVRAAIQCDRLCNEVWNAECKLPTDRRTSLQNTRIEIMKMEDTAAISAFKKLLANQA